ncbi:glycoside hydrolase family 3 protein [Atractiella rhizophila]|nr:glycoside hydrolase family 3 protein [Atractiella rhizophila]
MTFLPTLLLHLLPLSIIGVGAQITPRTWDEAKSLAAATISSLTLEEKVGLMYGLGQFGSQCVGNTHAVTRVGLPSICLNDGPAGVRLVDLVSAFPAETETKGNDSFNRDLIRQRGVAIGEEFRAKDPWLNGEGGFETIQGVQSVGVQAVAKHFLAYIQEHYRFTYSAEVDNRTLHEIYWQPYLRAIDADVSSVMCMYNRFNETYGCEDPFLIGEGGLLKGEGGFQGYVMSDWGASHGSAQSTVQAGLDMEQPGDWILVGGGVYAGLASVFTGGSLLDQVKNGAVSEALIDSMTTRGRLPYTVAKARADYPTDILYFSFDASPTIQFTEGLFLDYRHFDSASITPRFEFGFGLSYTTFQYSGLSISASGDGATISFTIANTGTVAGREVPQVYLAFPSGSGEPPQLLRGFDNVLIAAGAKQQVTISLRKQDLQIWDNSALAWVRPAGTFGVRVGASSRDIRLTGQF